MGKPRTFFHPKKQYTTSLNPILTYLLIGLYNYVYTYRFLLCLDKLI